MSTTGPTRRATIAGLAAAAFAAPAGMVAAASSPDAELIALCDEYVRLELAYRHAHDAAADDAAGEDRLQAAVAPIVVRMVAMRPRMNVLRAKTLAGMVARARAYRAEHWDETSQSFASEDYDQLGALLRDLNDAHA